jgi:hypothetical protein
VRPRYPHKLPVAIAVVIAGVVLVGWVARSTRAQGRVPNDPPTTATPAELSPVSPPPPASEPPVPVPVAEAPHALAGKASADARVGTPEPNAPSPESDDPEKQAQAFVEQNRKVAQDELKKLRDEAERLRARLGKVEGGIRRWEALLAALESGETAKRPGFKPVTQAPAVLEPAPVASVGAEPGLEPIRPATNPRPR